MKSRRTVVFVAPRFHSNYIGWLQRLSLNGWDSILLVATEGPSEDHRYATEVVKVPDSYVSRLATFLNLLKGANEPNRGPSIRWMLRKFKDIQPDAVIIRGRRSLLSLVASIACRILRIPVAIYQQDPICSPIREPWSHLLYDRLFFQAKMTTVFGYANSELSSGWKFVPFEPPSGLGVGERSDVSGKSLVTIGKFESDRKRIPELLEVVARLSDLDFHLTLIGSSDSEEIDPSWGPLIRAIGPGRLTTRRNIPHNQVLDVLAGAHVFVLPARDEPASIAVIEALALGARVVCSDSCGTRDYVAPGRGIIFPTDDWCALEGALRTALTQEVLPLDQTQVEMWSRRSANITTVDAFVSGLASVRHCRG